MLLLALSAHLTSLAQVNFTHNSAVAPHTKQNQDMLQWSWPQHEPKQIPDQTRVQQFFQ